MKIKTVRDNNKNKDKKWIIWEVEKDIRKNSDVIKFNADNVLDKTISKAA
jgi:hypothetical protein